MHDNTPIQTVGTDFSRSLEREPFNSGMFVRLNVLDYKRVEQSDHEREVVEAVLRQDKLGVRILRVKVISYEEVVSCITKKKSCG